MEEVTWSVEAAVGQQMMSGNCCNLLLLVVEPFAAAAVVDISCLMVGHCCCSSSWLVVSRMVEMQSCFVADTFARWVQVDLDWEHRRMDQ